MVGFIGMVMVFYGAFSCKFLEVKGGALLGEETFPYDGTAGLLRGGKECGFYGKEVLAEDIFFQITDFSATGALIAMSVGVVFAFLNAFYMPRMHCCIIPAYGSAFVFICFSFFIHKAEVW